MKFDELYYKALISNLISGFSHHRIITDQAGRPIDYEYLEVNKAFEKLTGLSQKDIIGRRVTEVIPGIEKDEFDWISFYGNIALGGEPASVEQYSDALNKWFMINAYSVEYGCFVTIFNDITELKQKELTLISQKEELGQMYEELAASEEELKQQNMQLIENNRIIYENEEKLKYMAFYDALTGLPNRAHFMEHLDMACKISKRTGKRCAILFMDLDNFKRINDTYGHIIGDGVLVEVAKRFLSNAREYDTVARLSGDEFAVIMQEFESLDDIFDAAERIRSAFNDPFDAGDISCYSSVSIGIAVCPEDGTEPIELLKHADTALYKAKDNEASSIQFFSAYMRDEVARKENIERRLRKAIERKEFVLYYQPQYDVNTGKLRGLEALVRWENSELGMVNPAYFIPIAEETGTILPLGELILEKACQTAQSWYLQYGCNVIVSVNISAVQLRKSKFVDLVKAVLGKAGLKPENLELEITESVLIHQLNFTIPILKELRELGIRISLDDFGTGYSSLSYLKNLPINVLKIDKSFIKNVCQNGVEKEITGAVIALVHKLGLEVIAEGVETKEQLEYLIEANCDSIQGYLTGKPVSEDMVHDIIMRGCMNIKKKS